MKRFKYENYDIYIHVVCTDALDHLLSRRGTIGESAKVRALHFLKVDCISVQN